MRICMLLTLAFLSHTAMAYEMEDITRVEFEVRDPKTKDVYYTGHEDITVDGQNIKREARYFDLDKKEVQIETVVFQKDSLKVSSYEFNNKLSGEETKLEGDDAELKVVYKESAKNSAKSGKLGLDKNSYHGKVVNNLILRNWKALLSNNIYKFSLIVPSRLEKLGFQLVHRKSYTEGSEKREVFALIPQNILIRTLAPHMEFDYAAGEKPLLRQFLCPSPLPIKGQKDKMVHYLFTYPERDPGAKKS